jgi:hypothetical protein
MAQRSRLIDRLLAAKEAIEDKEGPDALVLPPSVAAESITPGHPPGTQRLERARPRVPALLVPLPRVACSQAPQVGMTRSEATSWTHLGKLPGLSCTSIFFVRAFEFMMLFYFMQQGSLPGTLSQAAQRRCPCAK